MKSFTQRRKGPQRRREEEERIDSYYVGKKVGRAFQPDVGRSVLLEELPRRGNIQ